MYHRGISGRRKEDWSRTPCTLSAQGVGGYFIPRYVPYLVYGVGCAVAAFESAAFVEYSFARPCLYTRYSCQRYIPSHLKLSDMAMI